MVQPDLPSCFGFTHYAASPSKGAFKPNPQPYTTSRECLGKALSGNMFEDKHLPPQPNGTNLSGKAQGPLCKGWASHPAFLSVWMTILYLPQLDCWGGLRDKFIQRALAWNKHLINENYYYVFKMRIITGAILKGGKKGGVRPVPHRPTLGTRSRPSCLQLEETLPPQGRDEGAEERERHIFES